MGKQGSPRSPRPEPLDSGLSSGMKDYQIRSSETGNDPSIGRRMSGGDYHWNTKIVLPHGLKSDNAKNTTCKASYAGKKHTWLQKHMKSIVFMFGLMSLFFLLDSLMVSIFDPTNLETSSIPSKSSRLKVQLCTTVVIGFVLPYCIFRLPILVNISCGL